MGAVADKISYKVYTAFADHAGGGSRAAVVLNAREMTDQYRQEIATAIGLPATCFISHVGAGTVAVRFHSAQKEYPMCGHGTLCLMTCLLDEGALRLNGNEKVQIALKLPNNSARVEIALQADHAPVVMLDIKPAKVQKNNIDVGKLSRLLGISDTELDGRYPVETAIGDFIHLVVPVRSLVAMKALKPDFPALSRFCRENLLETVACFCADTMQGDHDFHVRDFCPAVGVPESAAAGTTNAALSVYWHRHGLLSDTQEGFHNFTVEQGMEMGSPSSVRIALQVRDGKVFRLQVGGGAVWVHDAVVETQNPAAIKPAGF